MQLRKVSNQAAEMFVAKLITGKQHDEIQDEIRALRNEFGEEEIDDSKQTEKELARLFSKALALGLTTEEAVVKMERHIETGRFSPEHYLNMWSKRIEDQDIDAVVEQELSRDDEQELTLSTPSGWPQSSFSRIPSKPAASIIAAPR